jgi:hypothetical protein
LRQPWFRSLSYYWVVDQAEFATDLIFTGREALAGLYPRLLDHAVVNFSAKEVTLAANRRYLDALAVVDDPAPAYGQVEELTEPMVVSGHSHAGFNPASAAEVGLFRAVLNGEYLLRGFRNAEIREALYGSIEDANQRRRQSHAVGRMLKRLHVRGLIVKVPRSHRWHVSG